MIPSSQVHYGEIMKDAIEAESAIHVRICLHAVTKALQEGTKPTIWSDKNFDRVRRSLVKTSVVTAFLG